jgi:glutamate synthase (NADPH) small chain
MTLATEIGRPSYTGGDLKVKTKMNEVGEGFDLKQALSEADRCLLCYDAPCSKGCPGGTDPGLFIRKLRLRNLTGAMRTILKNNPLGGTCSLVCPTGDLCEKECSATSLSSPIKIGMIQRFLVENARKTGFALEFPKKPAAAQKLSASKVAVIGSGPAGLACAAELAKMGHSVTVFEERKEPGGALRYALPEYRLVKELLKSEICDLEKLGVTFKCSTPIKSAGAAEKLLRKGFDALFVSPGLWEAETLVKGAPNAKGVFTSIEFLGSIREKKTALVTKNFKGKTICVIGGGDTAIDCAVSAIKLGAKDVYLAYRRSYNQMPAGDAEKQSALEAGVHLLLLNQPTGYTTDKKGKLTGVKLTRTRLGQRDLSGRPKPVEVKGSEWILEADTVVEAIGVKVARDLPKWLPSIKLSDKKLVIANEETGKTSVKGIFSGGDAVRGPSLVVWAIRDGKKAAKAVSEYLDGISKRGR